MRIIKPLAVGFLAATIAAPSLAGEVRIYPYASKENYCPTGLQPVTISGVISCGQPNQTISYQQVKIHVGQYGARKIRHAQAAGTCPEGVKGCY